MSVAEIVCAKCEKRYKMKPEYAGRTLKCSCGSKIVAPTLDEPEEEGAYDLAEPTYAAPVAPAKPATRPQVQAAAPMRSPANPLNYARPGRYGAEPEYAGVGRRWVAAFIDGFLTNLVVNLINAGVGGAMQKSDPLAAAIVGLGIAVLIPWLYEASMLSGTGRATLGKKWLGVQVTDLEGHQISFMRATGRHFGKYLSALALFIGFIWALFHPQKRTLHDLMAGTVVVRV